MQLVCLGLNHTTAPVSVRERVAYGAEEIEKTIPLWLKEFNTQKKGELSELMILSTCNRTEFYAVVEIPDVFVEHLSESIARQKSVSSVEFKAHSYTYFDKNCVKHIYEVVSGIDSMVLGETQIVGQFKKAVQLAKQAQGLGVYLNHLFQFAIGCAKQVRSTTAIGKNSVSLAAAAVRLSQRIFGNLSDCSILFIGAGEMIELCCAHFVAQQPKSITVANRTLEKGLALAKRFHGDAIRLQEVPEVISDYDILVSCTASTLPIIGLGMIERASKERRHKPICIIDLAVPRDVEPEVARLDDVFVYSMDELGTVVESGQESRKAAVEKAKKTITDEIKAFELWLRSRKAVPSIVALQDNAECIRKVALDEARRQLASGHATEEVLEKLSRTLTKKFLHDPTVLLRGENSCTDAEQDRIIDLISRFYQQREP